MRYYPCLNFPSDIWFAELHRQKKIAKNARAITRWFCRAKVRRVSKNCAAMAEKRGAVFVYVVYIYMFIVYRYYIYIYICMNDICMYVYIYIYYIPHSIHGTVVFPCISHQNLPDVGKYTVRPMDPEGYFISKYTCPHRDFP